MLIRILLKILYIDIETGFYLNGVVLAFIFAAVMLVTSVAVTFSSVRVKDTITVKLRGNRLLEISAVVLGVIIAATSVPKLMESLAIDSSKPVINSLPAWMLIAENILGICSGAALLYLAFCFLSGAQRSGTQGILALLPVVWQAISMVERYISFRQVNTVSDQFIETMYLIFATLFLLSHTRCLAGMAKSRRNCILWGLLAAHFGLVLISGQMAAVVVLGNEVSGPPLKQMIIIAAMSIYAIVVSVSLASYEKELN